MRESPAAPAAPTVMRHPAFALFWCARVGSTAAYHLQAVAIGWQVYALTDSALALGLIGLVQFLPQLVLTFVVGQVADRYDRKVIASLCQLVHGACAALLTIGTWSGWLGVDGIFALVAVVGAARAFESPTMAALVPGLVPPALLPRATAWSASANQTAQIVGPALGGLLYAIAPVIAFASAAALFWIAACLSALIRTERIVRPREPVTLGSLFSGIGFVWRRPLVLGTLSLDLFAVLLGGAVALLPIFARDILHTGRGASGCCAPRRRWVRWRCRCCWRIFRSGAESGGPCSPSRSCSAWRP